MGKESNEKRAGDAILVDKVVNITHIGEELLGRRIYTLNLFVTMFWNAHLSYNSIPLYPSGTSERDNYVDMVLLNHFLFI